MAYSTINKAESFINTIQYTGTGASNALTGVGFSPNFVWIKSRSLVDGHRIFDTAREAENYIRSESDAAQSTSANTLTAFGADGFTVGNDDAVNKTSETYVGWNWKAGTTTGLSGGTITPTAYSLNATSGISIIKYDGNGTSGATIAHGLGTTPKSIWIKRTDTSGNWICYHVYNGNTKANFMDLTNAPDASTGYWNDTSPTSTLFYLGNGAHVNNSSGTYVAYVFAEVKGYSRIDFYTGNAAADGPFVFTGFKPTWFVIKSITAGYDWIIVNNKTLGYNPDNNQLWANATSIEKTTDYFKIYSNGFKPMASWNGGNGSGAKYQYMAFGQPIVGSNNVVATAY